MYVGKLASSVGLSAQAIRYYERLGLLEKPSRMSSGYRVYSPATLERVRFIKKAQTLGLSLEEIREVLRLKYSGQSPCDCVRGVLKGKLRDLKKQMAEMEQLRREIEACLRAPRRFLRLPHRASLICPILETKVKFDVPRSGRKGGERK